MNKPKSMRSITVKEESGKNGNSRNNSSLPSALRKIFYIAQSVLTNKTEKLNLERFYHPGKGSFALFLTTHDKQVMEVLTFSEPKRSWLIDNEVCSNGQIYVTAPIDITFFALHYIRKHCNKKAVALDSIYDDADPGVSKILNNYLDSCNLKCISDVKTADGFTDFYIYNHKKTLAWLSLKTKRVAQALKANKIYCGNSVKSHNYAVSEKNLYETVQDNDYMRMACDYVGGYIELSLHDELIKHLKIPSDIQALAEEKNISNKRKSIDKVKDGAKRLKLINGEEESINDTTIKDSVHSISAKLVKSAPLKERPLSSTEKSLAKGAKGTKNITSFFTRKPT